MGNWRFDEVVVIDLEATCWDTTAEKEVFISEIIEIGVCLLNVLTGEVSKPRGLIVKPINAIVSPFCTSLTSITQDMVEQGMAFNDATNILKKEYGVSRKIMAAYGNYDQNMLKIECERNNLSPTV